MKKIFLAFSLSFAFLICQGQTTDSLKIVSGRINIIIPTVTRILQVKDVKDYYRTLKAEKLNLQNQVLQYKLRQDSLNANIIKWELRMDSLGISH